MAFGAFRRAGLRLQVTPRAAPGAGRVPHFLERKTCVPAVVLMAGGALAWVSARVVALRAIHIHMSVVRERHLAEARRKGQFGRRVASA